MNKFIVLSALLVASSTVTYAQELTCQGWPGSPNWYPDVECCDNQPCGLNEGECDGDAQCAGDLVCGGAYSCVDKWGTDSMFYDEYASWQCCVAPEGPATCRGQPGDAGWYPDAECCDSGGCGLNEGECDSDDQCSGDLVCGDAYSCRYAWGEASEHSSTYEEWNCCVEPVAAASTCLGRPGTPGFYPDADCCNDQECGLWEGECDTSDQCAGDLVCGAPGSCIDHWGWNHVDAEEYSTWQCCVPPGAGGVPSNLLEPYYFASNTVYDFGGRTISASSVVANELRPGSFICRQRNNIVIKNLIVTGGPVHTFWMFECPDVEFRNVEIINPSWIGIRVEHRPNWAYVNKNWQLHDVTVRNSGGHGLEFWELDGFTMTNLNVYTSNSCGVLFNRARNGTVNRVYGEYNDYDSVYATLRFANDAGPDITVDQTVSRFSGRGVHMTSGANGITLNWIDLQDAQEVAIRIVLSDSVNIWSGSARGNLRNCQSQESTNINWGTVDCECGVNANCN